VKGIIMDKTTTQETLAKIYPLIDIPFALSELSPRANNGGKHYSCECPSCGQKRAYIHYNKNNVPQISCNRRDSCGYHENIWTYVQNRDSLDNRSTLLKLAEYANYNLITNKYTAISNERNQQIAIAASKEVEYIEFDEEKEVVEISVSKYLSKYSSMKIEQKLKMVYTYIYQYSLQTNQEGKFEYYGSRGIDLNNLYIKQIGFLTSIDLKKLLKTLIEIFPIEDLIEFSVIKTKTKDDVEVLDRNGQPIYVFRQYCHKAFCVIPNFDLYSNMITGLKLRNTKLADWQPKSMKEPEMSRRDIVYPLPFAFNRDMILDKNACIFLVEGHVDGLSLSVTYSKAGQSEINYEMCNTYFIASPGTNGISEEFLGLLKGKFIVLAFDQDEAGKKGAYGEIKISYGDEKTSFVNDLEGKRAAESLIKDLEVNGIPFYKSVIRGMADKLKKAGARVFIKHWDLNLGGDINELLQNGHLIKIFNI
jgi:hypothetical protein